MHMKNNWDFASKSRFYSTLYLHVRYYMCVYGDLLLHFLSWERKEGLILNLITSTLEGDVKRLFLCTAATSEMM